MREQARRAATIGESDDELIALLEEAYRLRHERSAAMETLARAEAMLGHSCGQTQSLMVITRSAIATESGGAVDPELFGMDPALSAIDLRWRTRYHAALANHHSLRSELDEALVHLERYLMAAAEAGDDELAAWGHLMIGNVYRRTGDRAAGLEHLQRSLALYEEIGDRAATVRVLGSIGIIHHELADYDAAEQYLVTSLALSREIGDLKSEAASLANIGNVYFRKDDHERALECYQQALELRRKDGNLMGLATALNNMGTVQHSLKQYRESLVSFRECLEIRRSLPDRDAVAAVLNNLGNVHRDLGDIATAQRHHAEALEITRTTKVPLTLMHIHKAMAQTEEAAGNLAAALEHLKEHHRIAAEIQGEETRRRVHGLETARRIELAEKEAQIERLRNVELAEAHRQLQTAQAQLVHAEKMSSLGTLTAGIAHEINNPVNFIRAGSAPLERNVSTIVEALVRYEALASGTSIEALMREHREGAELDEVVAEIRELLRGISDGAGRIAEIIRNLRTFSRLDEDELKTVDLNDGIESTIALLRPRLGAIEVVLELGAIPAVECNPGQINQVVMNLVSNAIDAIDGAGRIVVATSADESSIRLSVSDTGAGIAPEHLPHIFEPFYTTRDVGRGQGLGLAISHGIIEKHGGSISVESTVGSGSTFTVTLPLRHDIPSAT
jgi:two-component system, NtrC family, sensor kinase